MDNLTDYTVAAYTGLHVVPRQGDIQVTPAVSPENAAELVLGEHLVRFGRVRDLRAKVTFDDLSGGTKTMLLYRPSK